MDTITSAEINEDTRDKRLIWRSQIKSRIYFIFGGLAGIVIVLIVSAVMLNRPYTFQGSLIEPSQRAPEIRFEDQHGKIFSLSEERGNVVLIFFGYTHCPDVCPVTLYQYKQIREVLEDKAKDVKFIFITVDPERDTREVIKTHLAKFDPAIIGLTADIPLLEKVWQDYGVALEKREMNSTSGYLVDHTARLYVVDKKGHLRLTYPFGIEVEKIIEDVNQLLREHEG